MASKTKVSETDNIIENEDDAPEPTTQVMDDKDYPAATFGPDNGADVVIDAWRFLSQVFGATRERFDLTPEGVYAVNVKMAKGFNPKQIIEDMGGGKRHPRLDLSLYQYIVSNETEPYSGDTASTELTRSLTANFRNEDNGGRSPDYAKAAVAAYKKANNLEKPRGRKPHKILDQIATLSPDLLAGLDPDALARLREALAKAENIQHTAVK